MSLQRFANSIFGLTQETSLALANIHFDFSLYKVEAPVEFQGLGRELTARRKQAAEEGTPHITARKLGALFRLALPSTPALVKAYGRRATEIASRRDVNPKATPSHHGLFADHVGIDGTSLWAAATSGPDAVAVHLLACMLARMWSTPEAISIWVELVDQRKAELAAVNDTEASYLECLEASRILVLREQLAEWDASARAWLRAADQAMDTKQKQLMLILDNVNIPVNNKLAVYHSVLQAWTSAMVALDHLVQGIPQSIQDGGVLVGLASWHLYPDIVVLGDSQTEVVQRDDLITAGGLVTIGLQLKGHESSGVYWSLPLSRLRYYGRPVVAKRYLDAQARQLTVDQLTLVVFGLVTQHWGMDAKDIASCLTCVWDRVSKAAGNVCSPGTPHWFGLFAKASHEILDEDGLSGRVVTQLMRLGRKQAPDFVCPGSRLQHIPPMFGLLSFSTFFGPLTTTGKIEVLRSLAAKFAPHVPDATFIIRVGYRRLISDWEYATALPIRRSSVKRSAEDQDDSGSSTGVSSSGHIRWLEKPNTWDAKRARSMGEEVIIMNDTKARMYCYSSTVTWEEPLDALFLLSEAHQKAKWSLEADEELEESGLVQARFRYLAGDEDSVSLFWTPGFYNKKDLPEYEQLTPSHLIAAAKNSWLDGDALVKDLQDLIRGFPELYKSLRILASVSSIYKLLPLATINLGVLSTPLHSMAWATESESPPSAEEDKDRFSMLTPSWPRTFACIAFFESGTLALAPIDCQNVMAISVGDSLYVATPLICDPSERPVPYEVQMIRGNIGRPGIALLVPPSRPELPDFDRTKWTLVNHLPYDGRDENSFQATSLHMSFTGLILPIATLSPSSNPNHGYRDAEIYYMETRVTVHHHGEEMGDLDILGQLESRKLRRLPPCADCPANVKAGAKTQLINNPALTMIDNWYEMLEGPDQAAVARSAGNWLGRLALAVVALQLGCEVVVANADSGFCWSCLVDSHFSNPVQVTEKAGKKEDKEHSMVDVAPSALALGGDAWDRLFVRGFDGGEEGDALFPVPPEMNETIQCGNNEAKAVPETDSNVDFVTDLDGLLRSMARRKTVIVC